MNGQQLWHEVYLDDSTPESYGKLVALPDNGFALIGTTSITTSPTEELEVPVVIRTNSYGQQEPLSVLENEHNIQNPIYPNPTTRGQSVRIATPDQAEVAVFDVAGRCVASHRSAGSNFQLPTAALPAGLYVVAVHGNAQRHTHRLVVE